MVIGALTPAGALSEGAEATAEASEAQDARMARFSATDNDRLATTSFG